MEAKEANNWGDALTWDECNPDMWGVCRGAICSGDWAQSSGCPMVGQKF